MSYPYARRGNLRAVASPYRSPSRVISPYRVVRPGDEEIDYFYDCQEPVVEYVVDRTVSPQPLSRSQTPARHRARTPQRSVRHFESPYRGRQSPAVAPAKSMVGEEVVVLPAPEMVWSTEVVRDPNVEVRYPVRVEHGSTQVYRLDGGVEQLAAPASQAYEPSAAPPVYDSPSYPVARTAVPPSAESAGVVPPSVTSGQELTHYFEADPIRTTERQFYQADKVSSEVLQSVTVAEPVTLPTVTERIRMEPIREYITAEPIRIKAGPEDIRTEVFRADPVTAPKTTEVFRADTVREVIQDPVVTRDTRLVDALLCAPVDTPVVPRLPEPPIVVHPPAAPLRVVAPPPPGPGVEVRTRTPPRRIASEFRTVTPPRVLPVTRASLHKSPTRRSSLALRAPSAVEGFRYQPPPASQLKQPMQQPLSKDQWNALRQAKAGPGQVFVAAR